MTPEQTIELAKKAEVESLCRAYPDQFKRFAHILGNAKLEEAAKVCELWPFRSAPACAEAIRSMKT